MRRIPLQHTLNTRDLGGYPLLQGGLTKYGMFLRSDVPAQVTDGDVELLRSMKITSVLDLRSDRELAERPCALSFDTHFRYSHRMLNGGDGMPSSREGVPLFYLEMLEGESMRDVMRLLAESDGGVLFHCAAGKDRTGVVSSLLLSLAGVSHSDIVDDYQYSRFLLEPMLRYYLGKNPELDPDIVTPRPEFIEKFLAMFFERYRSVENYLLGAGLASAEVMRLREKLAGR